MRLIYMNLSKRLCIQSFIFILLSFILISSSSAQYFYQHEEFCMGADMSFVNHIQDKGAEWREKGQLADPYELFAEHGGNCARFRLWNNPQWTKQVYIDAGEEATQLYHDFNDVKRAIGRAKEAGLAVCMDFHYSDFWADPGKQYIPAAWAGLTFGQLRDSLYDYTFKTLSDLNKDGLMPEYVQVGNEINNGFVHPAGILDNNKANLAVLLNSAIAAIRNAGASSSINPKVIIHIAQPENVEWWFDTMIPAGLTDFDIIGFSYYTRWSQISLRDISQYVAHWKEKYQRKVMCVETTYLRKLLGTIPGADELEQMEPDFYPSVSAQKNYLVTLTQEIIDGGGCGIIPWEPFWVKGHRMVDAWGVMGSNWGNNSWFDYSNGNEVEATIDFLNYPYTGITGTLQQRDSMEVTIHLYGGGRIIADNAVYIEGSLTGGQQKIMSVISDTSWNYTCRLPAGSFHLFRFRHGIRSDNIPENYRVGNATDRAICVPDSQVTYLYTWNGGPTQPVPDSVYVTFQVDMRGQAVSCEGVYMYGNFFDAWGPRMPMTKICDSAWIKTLFLPGNREYWFRFFNGYGWENSEIAPIECRVGDKNRFFVTPAKNAGFIFQYNICGATACDTCGHAICDITPSNRAPDDPDPYFLRLNNDNKIIQVSYPETVSCLKVYDMQGRLILQQPVSRQTESLIGISSWTPGMYVLAFTDRSRTLKTKKFAVMW